MVKFILPLLALPFGEGVTPFVSAHRFKGGALNTQKGIHLRNIANRHAGQIQIGIANPNPNLYSNQVHYLNAPAPSATEHYFGYWFENCDNLEVDNNIALSNTVPLGAGIDKHLRGFSVDNTTNSNFCSNKAEQMGSGVWVYNVCTGTYFKGTNTNTCVDNFHFANATLPDQSNAALDDYNNSWTNAVTWDFNGSLSPGVSLNWYTHHYLTLIINPLLINFSANNANGTSSDCQTAQGPRDNERRENFGSAVNDTTDYGEDFPEENKYLDKEGFYKQARNDSTILFLSEPDDAIFIAAFDSLDSTNVGKIADVKEEIAAGDSIAAVIMNSSITPSNVAEINSKATHELMLAYNSSHKLTASQKQQGHGIAIQTALEGGMDVYIIRAILNEDVVDDIEAAINMRRSHHQTESNNVSAIMNVDNLYPNPAGNSVSIISEKEFSGNDLISVYNFLRQKVLEFKLTPKNKSFTFDTSVMPQGIYFVQHSANNVVVSENKLVIIR